MRFWYDDRPYRRVGVIGVGKAGMDIVDRLITMETSAFLISADMDIQALRNSRAYKKILLGEGRLGAGGDPKIGKNAAEETEEEIRDALDGLDLLIITTSPSGGTGAGASPVIAKIARDLDILTLAMVVKPPLLEGLTRCRNAMESTALMREYADGVACYCMDRMIDRITDPIEELYVNMVEAIANALPGFVNAIVYGHISLPTIGRMFGYYNTVYLASASVGNREDIVAAAERAAQLDWSEKDAIGADESIVIIESNEDMKTTYEERSAICSALTRNDDNVCCECSHLRDNDFSGIRVTVFAAWNEKQRS